MYAAEWRYAAQLADDHQPKTLKLEKFWQCASPSRVPFESCLGRGETLEHLTGRGGATAPEARISLVAVCRERVIPSTVLFLLVDAADLTLASYRPYLGRE